MLKKGFNILKFLWVVLTFAILDAAVVVVNSSGDDPAVNPLVSPLTASNTITLRSAIEHTNALGGTNTIDFNIPGTGPFLISVGTGIGVMAQALPVITNELTINGYSQTGSSLATSVSNAIIPIILNGSVVTVGAFQDGLTLGAGSSNSVIRGLVIQGFPENGINIQAGTSQSILGNYIGTDQSGESAVPNLGNGIRIGSGVSLVSVGSTAGVGIIGNRNLISGQEFTIGATPISGAGIFIEGSDNEVIGNYIGTNATGASALPNRTGIYIFAPIPTVPLNNTIQNNIIAFNNGGGVNEGSGIIVDGANQNSLLSNSIFNNLNDGISLINNGNDNLAFPETTTAVISGTTLNLAGTFSSAANPNSNFIIQFFTNPTSSIPTQGETFVGQTTVITDASGSASFSDIRLFSNVLAGQFVSATATLLDANGVPLSTSAYSLNLLVTQGQASGTIDTSITFDPFPGIRAQTVVIDSAGRVIVGGLNGSIVRYNNVGAIDLTYEQFPGIAVKAMVIDGNDIIVAVGTDGFVVKYNANGTINSTFESFPGVLANAVIFDSAGDIIVGGLQSTIVRYSNSGINSGTIVATFTAFPGTAVNGLALDAGGRILACGLQGQVVRYASTGILDIVYEEFPGICGNSIIVDSAGRALVVGKTNAITTGILPAANNTNPINVVRYGTNGIIDLNFSPFVALNAQNVLLDLNENVVVCGLESLVVQYNGSTGAINFNFEDFPGINATWMALTSANQIIVVGWEGSVVRYYS